MITLLLIRVSMAQVRTSTNTCTVEKSIFKLNIRQRVLDLPSSSTVRNIDAYALCQETYMYDYMWLSQLWIPGQFNYKNTNAQQTDDYLELQSIKEYLIDPELGLLTDLYYFQQNVRKYCPHMKFLGEFSFYISTDSYLMQNRSRFLRRPLTDNMNVYNPRYDKDDYVWAINDQFKTIPFAAAWNYFDPIVLNDMKDVISKIILQQHRLDGIVFMQPSLGLYSVMQKIFPTEIQFYGRAQYLQDFYFSIGLKLNQQDVFYIGGEDNLKTKIILQNYLSQIYDNPSPQVWSPMNYTFGSFSSNINKVDDKTVRANSQTGYGQVNTQSPPSSPTCIIYYIINQNGGARFGILNQSNTKFVMLFCGSLKHDTDSLLDGTPSFSFANTDMVEMQYDPSSGQFIFMKYSTDLSKFQQFSMMIPGTYVYLRFMFNIQLQSQIQIKFPFFFSTQYKHASLTLQNQQQMTITTNLNQQNNYIGQIWPSINQNENNVTLNFQISNLPTSSVFGIGVCNQETVNINSHIMKKQLMIGTGTYLYFSNGYLSHNSSSQYNNLEIGNSFDEGNIISVGYVKQNSSIQFYKNQAFIYSLPLIERVKNLNFCVAMQQLQTTINLVY